jgi:hypothetical protein
MGTIKAEFTGMGNVLAQLRGIDERVRKKALRKVVSAASARLNSDAKARVPTRKPRGIPSNWSYTGKQLKRAMGRKVKSYGGTAVGIVGARKGYRIQVGVLTRDGPAGSKRQGKKGDPVFVDPVKYLHLVLLGTGHSPATNFLAAARDAAAPDILAQSAKIVDAAIGGA